MNKPKIFVGATACLLAIAGVAATKAAKFGLTKVSYFTQVNVPGLQTCVCPTCLMPCTITTLPAPRCFYYTCGPNHTIASFPLYTAVIGWPCRNPVKYRVN